MLIVSAGSDGSLLLHEDDDVRRRDGALADIQAHTAASTLQAVAQHGQRRHSAIPGEKPTGETTSADDAAAAVAAAAAAKLVAEANAAEGRIVVRRVKPTLRFDTDRGMGHATDSSISCLAVSASQRLAASGGTDSAVLLWATDTGKREARWQCAGG